MFSHSCLQQNTVLKISHKRCWFDVRNTEFLPEAEVSSEMKIQANEAVQEKDQNNEYRIIERQRHFWPKKGNM
jgi:hypothetical protein